MWPASWSTYMYALGHKLVLPFIIGHVISYCSCTIVALARRLIQVSHSFFRTTIDWSGTVASTELFQPWRTSRVYELCSAQLRPYFGACFSWDIQKQGWRGWGGRGTWLDSAATMDLTLWSTQSCWHGYRQLTLKVLVWMITLTKLEWQNLLLIFSWQSTCCAATQPRMKPRAYFPNQLAVAKRHGASGRGQ